MATRPLFAKMWTDFSIVNCGADIACVGKKIGGKVEQNLKSGIFKNACAIRMSYCLNKSSVEIKPGGTWATVSGGDKKWYIYRVRDILTFLNHTFGKPDKTVKKPKSEDFTGVSGIIAFGVSGWSDATGHVTLWNGSACSDRCYFGKAEEASLWVLN